MHTVMKDMMLLNLDTPFHNKIKASADKLFHFRSTSLTEG